MNHESDISSAKDIFTTKPTQEANLRESRLKTATDFEVVTKAAVSHKQMLDVLNIGIVAQETDGRISYSNASAEQILGLSTDELHGRTSFDPLWQAIHEDGSPFLPENHPAMVTLRTGQPCCNVVMGIHKPNGTLTWILVNTQPIFDSDQSAFFTTDSATGSRTCSVVSSFVDITFNKQATEALRLEKARLETLFEASPIAEIVVRWDDGVCLNINRRFTEIFGYNREEIVGHTSVEIPFFQTVEDRTNWLMRLRQEKEVTGAELALLHKQGYALWVLASARLVEINGQLCIVTIFKDITERKRMEVALRQSEELYRNLARNLPNTSVLLFDHDLRFIVAEGQSLEKNGFTQERVEGKTLWEVLPPETCKRLLPYYQAALAGIEHTFEDSYEDEFYLVRAAPVRNVQGRIFAGMLLSQDITTIKRLEEKANAEKERLSVTLRSIGDGVISTDLEGKVTLLNGVAEQLTGWGQEEAVGKPIEEVFRLVHQKSEQPLLNPVRETLITGQINMITAQMVLVSRDGTKYRVVDSCAPIRNALNQIVGAVLVFRDNTQQLQLNEALMVSSKLEALGVLAGGIAHDFNNSLMQIVGNIELAQLIGYSDDEAKNLLEEAVKAALRSKEITRQLLTFAKGGAPVKKTAKLAEIVADSTSFVLHGTNVIYHLNLPDDLWAVEVDSGQISQVVQNLVINARQAMPNGGNLFINATNVQLGSGEVPSLVAGNYVCLSVKDTGVGIAAENLSRIFDPYFTTKPSGNGLGLAVCYSVIRQHNGVITAESELGIGTTFRIYLPALANFTFTAESRHAHLVSGSGRILVMDDETSLQQVLRRALSRLGYEVVIAANGKEAIRQYCTAQQEQRPFNLVLLDLTVPGEMGGLQTLKELKQLNPKVRAIVSSGYSNDPIIANYQEYGFVGMLIKPYKLEELSELLYKLSQA